MEQTFEYNVYISYNYIDATKFVPGRPEVDEIERAVRESQRMVMSLCGSD